MLGKLIENFSACAVQSNKRATEFYFLEDIKDLLFLGNTLLFLGFLGILACRMSLMRLLMSIELSLLGIGLQFIAYSLYFNDLRGQIAALFVLTVAGAESAIGLAIFLSLYRLESSLGFDSVRNLRG